MGSYLRFEGQHFYMDRIFRIKYPFSFLFLIVFIILLDFFTSLPHFKFLPENTIGLVAYLSRLSSIIFAFFTLRISYYKLNNVLDYLVKEFGEKEELKKNLLLLKNQTLFLNKPKHHVLAGILANVIYLIILYYYVFPVLKWEPFHVFSNAIWVGTLGIGLYVAIFGIRFYKRFLNILRSYRMVDLYREDRMGGFSYICKLSINLAIFSSLAAGLWIGSIPYAFKHTYILLILCLGLTIETLILLYAFYQLHSVLNFIKRVKTMEFFSILKEAQLISEGVVPLEVKVDLLLKLSLSEFALTQIDRLRLWPISYRDVLELFGILTSFLPIILQYLLATWQI